MFFVPETWVARKMAKAIKEMILTILTTFSPSYTSLQLCFAHPDLLAKLAKWDQFLRFSTLASNSTSQTEPKSSSSSDEKVTFFFFSTLDTRSSDGAFLPRKKGTGKKGRLFLRGFLLRSDQIWFMLSQKKKPIEKKKLDDEMIQ